MSKVEDRGGAVELSASDRVLAAVGIALPTVSFPHIESLPIRPGVSEAAKAPDANAPNVRIESNVRRTGARIDKRRYFMTIYPLPC